MTDPYGARVRVFPYLHSYIADLQEGYLLGVVLSGRCLQCMAHESRLNSLTLQFDDRTEAFTWRLIKHADTVERSGTRSQISQAKKLLRDAGIPLAMKVRFFVS